ncbi:MAG TPA: alpha-L-rhamnosidase C-terminal domain-containing protein, partial [Candidatus Hydrogenedentes bacterium]|nr:alpha-L-rhamnosidase C-terminal domain-containing protein [Candidatus Hydrogenedentota bacterium]
MMTSGFQSASIRPYVVGDLTSVNATLDTQYGRYASGWRKDGEQLTLEVTVPANCQVQIAVPAPGKSNPVITESGKTVWENGQYVAGQAGIASGRADGEWRVFAVGSGTYQFVCR